MTDDSQVPLPQGPQHEPPRGAMFDLGFHSAPKATLNWQPPGIEDLQKSLTAYEVTAFVARGGMGAVYKGVHRALKRIVAIKVLPPEIEQGDADYAERFKREAQAMAQLSHPGIVAVHDAGETSSGLLYFVMEFIEGSDVAQLLVREGRLDPSRALKIAADVLDALAFAHEEGIIHRDIKPSNIMLDGRGRVKVADFGLAKVITQDSMGFTRSDLALGSADFIAPEALIPGTQLDARADLYAVGVMLYQMLTGKIPRGSFDPPSGIVEQLDPRLDAIVLKAMKTDREKRYGSAAKMKEAVEALVQGSVGTPDRTDDSGRTMAKPTRAPLIAMALVIIALAASGFIYFTQSPSAQVSAPPALTTSPSSRSEAEALKLAGVSSAVSPAVSSHSGSTVLWHDWLAETEAAGTMPPQLIKEVGGWRIKEANQGGGVYARFYASIGSPQLKNAAIRVTYFPPESAPGRQAFLAVRENSDRQSWRAMYKEDRWVLNQVINGIGTDLLKMQPMPALLSVAKEPRVIELRAVGNTLALYDNGILLGSQHDIASATGQVGFNGPPGMLIQKVEWADLDGLPEAEALKLAGVSVGQGEPSWQPAFGKALDQLVTADGKRTFKDGWLNVKDVLPNANAGFRQGMARIHLGWLPESMRVKFMAVGTDIEISAAPTGDTSLLRFNGKGFEPNPPKLSASVAGPRGGETELKLAWVGGGVYGWIQGQFIGSLPLSPNRDRVTHIVFANNPNTAAVRVRDFEVINLDGLPEAEALKLAGVVADGSTTQGK